MWTPRLPEKAKDGFLGKKLNKNEALKLIAILSPITLVVIIAGSFALQAFMNYLLGVI